MVRFLHWQISLQEESQKILVSDCFSLHERLVRIHQRGIPIRGIYMNISIIIWFDLILYQQASLIWGKKLNTVFFPIFSFRNF